MRVTTNGGTCVLAILSCGVLAGCAAQGARYSEVAKDPVASGKSRIVLLRPNNRYDDYSLSKAVVKLNDAKAGKLAYGGFLQLDVDAGDVAVKVQAKNALYGTCELRFATEPGATVYLDVAPRTASVVAGAIGTLAGAAAVNAPAEAGLNQVPLGQGAAETAVGGTVGDAAASAAESYGKTCGGPYKLTPLHASAALEQLEKLTSSE